MLLVAVLLLAGCGEWEPQIEEIKVGGDSASKERDFKSLTEDILSADKKNTELPENIPQMITEFFSVLGDVPEMQYIPEVSDAISQDFFYSLLYLSSLDLRLLHIYENFDERIEFRTHENIKINDNEYVISVLVFHPRERDPYPKVGLREGFLMKYFVSVQKAGEEWSITNIERVNSGHNGKGNRFTKYPEKETQQEIEKIAPLRKFTYRELMGSLNSLSESREDDKASFLDSLVQKRPSYLRSAKEEDSD